MSYAADLRRETPLGSTLRERIREHGPMPLREFMSACLGDPENGYYRTQVAIGQDGDFITAPEISQVFGELIGLWCAVVWQQMGQPGSCNLVEVGPGRGTLMADLLRASRIVPGFLDAARVTLVEPNPVLQGEQRIRLRAAGREICWLSDLTEIPPGPTILVANEVLDVLPVTQLVLTDAGWRERAVVLGTDGRLEFGQMPGVPVVSGRGRSVASARAGDILEIRDGSEFPEALARLVTGGPIAGLFIDYGHAARAFGDTVQAVRGQQYEHPLTSPGQADLSAQVDFAAFADEVRASGLLCQGPVAQAAFLGSLGIVERASRLMSANPAMAGSIEAGVARLMAPGGMGTRFLALGVRSSDLPLLPGFHVVDNGSASS